MYIKKHQLQHHIGGSYFRTDVSGKASAWTVPALNLQPVSHSVLPVIICVQSKITLERVNKLYDLCQDV